MMKTDYAIATGNGPSKGDANADLELFYWPLKRNNRRRI
jgi:hypothetical protein